MPYGTSATVRRAGSTAGWPRAEGLRGILMSISGRISQPAFSSSSARGPELRGAVDRTADGQVKHVIAISVHSIVCPRFASGPPSEWSVPDPYHRRRSSEARPLMRDKTARCHSTAWGSEKGVNLVPCGRPRRQNENTPDSCRREERTEAFCWAHAPGLRITHTPQDA